MTLTLAEHARHAMPSVKVVSMPGAEVTTGPVRIGRHQEIVWKIRARQSGQHRIVFEVDGRPVEKKLVVGDGFLPVSAVRPPPDWTAILVHPLEKPFTEDSLVRSIRIDYPDRVSWTSGTDWWLVYFFIASLVFALVFKPFLNVKI